MSDSPNAVPLDPEALREAIKAARYRLDCVGGGLGGHESCPSIYDLEALVRAAESTLPKTKMVEVWRVEWARQNSQDRWMPNCSAFGSGLEADCFAATCKQAGHTCIHVTGPHLQCVPS